MTPPVLERSIRAQLPFLRFLQTYMPLRVSQWVLKQSMARVRPVGGVAHELVSVDGVPCHWLIPRASTKHQALLYLHGGGFVFGLSSPYLDMVAYLAQRIGIRALLVDYRVAPRHPFPAPLDDCVTACRWLAKEGMAPQNIVVAGDSAGGNLTITTMMKLRDSGDPLPAAAACLSPVADLSDRDNFVHRFKDPLLPPRARRLYRESYVGHHDARDPLISPVFGDWHGLPPLLVHAGEDEILREQAVRIEELARAAGVDVRLEIYPRMWHVWQLYLALPQAVQSLDDIARFLKSHLGLATRQPAPG